MSATTIAKGLPPFLRRQLIHFECLIEKAVSDFSNSLPDGSRVLDAGAGEGQYAGWFALHRYTGVDLGIGDAAWNYHELDAVADLCAMPFADETFDAAINIVTLEHLPEPLLALKEIARVLRPGGKLLIAVPHEWEVHQSPHDFYRYTRHGLRYLLERADFVNIEIQPAGGYFRLLSRRLLNAAQFSLVLGLLFAPLALVLPLLDGLDKEKNFTVGYIATAHRR